VELKVAKAYSDFLSSRHRYAILYGGAGSGKSWAAAQKMLIRLLVEHPHKFLVIRKVARTLRESVFALFLDLIEQLGLSEEFKVNRTNMTIEAFNGNKIVFFGLDDPEKIKSIAGITGIWIEEATELTQEDFDQLDLRLRGETRHYKQIVVTFNPVSSTHWIKKRFFDNRPPDTFILKTTYLDNPFIDDEYRAVMERIKRDNYDYYRIYALGEWGTLKGVIYPDYKVVDEMPKYFEDEFLGIDFGYNHAYAIVHVRIDGKNLYADEIFYKREWENPRVVEWMEKNYPHFKRVAAYADSARPDLISEYRHRGFNIHQANKSVFEGINAVKSFDIHITRRSQNIIREIDTYVWKMDRDGNPLDEPVKHNDDAMDALRYALTPYIKKHPKARSMRISLI